MLTHGISGVFRCFCVARRGGVGLARSSHRVVLRNHEDARLAPRGTPRHSGPSRSGGRSRRRRGPWGSESRSGPAHGSAPGSGGPRAGTPWRCAGCRGSRRAVRTRSGADLRARVAVLFLCGCRCVIAHVRRLRHDGGPAVAAACGNAIRNFGGNADRVEGPHAADVSGRFAPGGSKRCNAGGGTRTPKGFIPADFESAASASSATPAGGHDSQAPLSEAGGRLDLVWSRTCARAWAEGDWLTRVGQRSDALRPPAPD